MPGIKKIELESQINNILSECPKCGLETEYVFKLTDGSFGCPECSPNEWLGLSWDEYKKIIGDEKEKDYYFLLIMNSIWYRHSGGISVRNGKTTKTFKEYLKRRGLQELVDWLDRKEGKLR